MGVWHRNGSLFHSETSSLDSLCSHIRLQTESGNAGKRLRATHARVRAPTWAWSGARPALPGRLCGAGEVSALSHGWLLALFLLSSGNHGALT